MDDRTVNLILKMTLDGQARSQIKGDLDAVKKELAAMRSAADETRKAMNQALAKGDTEGAKRLQSDLEKMEKTIKDVGEEAQQAFGKRLVDATRKSAAEMRQWSEKIQNVSRTFAVVGGVITGGMAGLAKNYVSQVGGLETTGQKWLTTSRQLEQANLRLGRASAQALQPWYDQLARITEMAAEYAEKNPSTISGLAAAGVAALGAGGVGEAVGQGIKLIADVKFMTASTLMNKAADKMLLASTGMNTASKTGALGQLASLLTKSMIPGAAANLAGQQATMARLAMYTGSKAPAAATLFGMPLTAAGGISGASMAAAFSPLTLLGGAGLGVMGYNAIANKMGLQSAGQIGGKAASIGAYGLGYLFGGQEKAQEWFKATAKALGQMGDSAKEAAEKLTVTGDAFKIYSQYAQEEATAKREYQKEVATIERETEQERLRITEQYGRERAKAEKQYESQRSQVVQEYQQARTRALQDHYRQMEQMEEDYQRQETEAEQSYQQQRSELTANLGQQLSEIAKDYHKSLEDLEKSHRERLKQLAQDHNDRMEDLVASRDALGMMAEQRRYKREVQDENEAYRDQKNELRQQMKEQTEAAKEEYAKQLQELQANYEQQRAKRQEEYERQRTEADEQFALQQARSKQDFENRLKQMDEEHKIQMQEMEQQFQDELRQLEQQKRQKLQELQRSYEEERVQRADALRKAMQELYNIETEGQGKMLDATRQYVTDMLAEAERLKSESQSGENGEAPARALGGYVWSGLFRMHDNEYVMNPQTTQVWEKALGGKISQDKMLAAALANRHVIAGGSTGAVQNINLSMVIPGSATMRTSERQAIIDASASAAVEAVSDSLAKMGRW